MKNRKTTQEKFDDLRKAMNAFGASFKEVMGPALAAILESLNKGHKKRGL